MNKFTFIIYTYAVPWNLHLRN